MQPRSGHQSVPGDWEGPPRAPFPGRHSFAAGARPAGSLGRTRADSQVSLPLGARGCGDGRHPPSRNGLRLPPKTVAGASLSGGTRETFTCPAPPWLAGRSGMRKTWSAVPGVSEEPRLGQAGSFQSVSSPAIPPPTSQQGGGYCENVAGMAGDFLVEGEGPGSSAAQHGSFELAPIRLEPLRRLSPAPAAQKVWQSPKAARGGKGARQVRSWTQAKTGPPRLAKNLPRGRPEVEKNSSGGSINRIKPRSVKGARPLPLSYTLQDGKADRPALVFLHGLFGCKTNFNSIAKALAQQTGRKVLTVDARNHGDSPHNPDMSYKAMSQDLQDLLPQLGLVPCVLIGHSMGGKTAMLLALQRPDLVERLIAVDISPVETTSVSDFPSYMAAMRAVDIPSGVPRSQARKLADEQLSRVVQDTAVRQFLLTNLVEVDGRFVWRLNLDALSQNVQEILNFPPHQDSYSGPTLFLLGGNSQFVLPSHHSEIKRLFPRAQMQTVPNAGHWIHADRPQDFMAAVRGFLA
ncbi:sn-1-specific diacylglycerol lipase ABHD11 [Rhynchocyon petersi]